MLLINLLGTKRAFNITAKRLHPLRCNNNAPEFGLDLKEELVIADKIPDEIQPNNDDVDDEDKVDEEEEADFRYGDDECSKDEGSDQAEDNDDDEEDEDHSFDDL